MNKIMLLVATTSSLLITTAFTTTTASYAQLIQSPENWDPMQVGPVPLLPPTNDPPLLEFDQLFSDCKTQYHDKVIQEQPNKTYTIMLFASNE
jgi:hypothetical protein